MDNTNQPSNPAPTPASPPVAANAAPPTTVPVKIEELFDKAISTSASDIHLLSGVPPVLRIDGKLTQLTSYAPLSKENLSSMIYPLLNDAQKEMLETNRSLDFSYGYGGGDYGDKGRFRINLYFQKGTLAGAFRLLPNRIKSIEDLKLPNICHNLAKLKQGFVLVTGPTGHGKSSTLAAILNEINLTHEANILTIEDPIEFIFPKGKSIISQRELLLDTHSWAEGLKSALREDPDVVMVGEMRDPESMAAAITIAETGHLVFSTLHTNSASQSIDRIIDSFPEHQQNQIRIQLAAVIEGIISQRLVPKIDGGRMAACEVLLATNAIKANVREGKTHLLDSTIETSQDIGMMPMEVSLANLVKSGTVSLEVAKTYALREELFMKLVS